MGLVIWLIVGGIVGWLACVLMRTGDQQDIVLNVAVGVVGAFLGGWLISPLVGAAAVDPGGSVGTVVVSLIGAVLLLAVVNLFRRGGLR